LFLVAERVEGRTLAEHIALRHATVPTVDEPTPADVADLAGRIVDLVAAVHTTGLVLRDLSPNNVMIAPDGSVRLIDLEYATLAGTRIPQVIGTPGFIAPEVLAPTSDRIADPAADRYSLGAVLFFLAAGVDPAFASDPAGTPSPLALMARQIAWMDRAMLRL